MKKKKCQLAFLPTLEGLFIAFADTLKRFRKEYSLTQKQVADAIGIQKNAYQAYEYGKVKPSIEILFKIASHFNVSADYLLGLGEAHDENEVYLLNIFRDLNSEGCHALIDYAEFLRFKYRAKVSGANVKTNITVG